MDKTIKDYNVITENVYKQLLKAQKPGATSSPKKIVYVFYKLAVGQSKAFRTVVGTDAKMVLILRKLLPIKIFLNFLGNRFIK
ncbi:hypothetical protein [Chryseobacterium sp. Mn2064]|uniref:hypothetical protein n=1 Tax=Chryseobacterium sp. Mn2064 TaxID=3395263 RepID=UPI003BE60EE3